MQELGRARGWCPYYLARRLINLADVVVYSYQYILDPRIHEHVSKEFRSNSIVVFDEAHNIDNVCVEAFSVEFDNDSLHAATTNLRVLSEEVDRVRQVDAGRLREEYDRLVAGLAAAEMPAVLQNPVPDAAIREAVPQQVRDAEDFVKFMRRIVTYLRERLQVRSVIQESPALFLRNLQTAAQTDPKAMRACSQRLGSLLNTLQLTNIDQYFPLALVAGFASMVASFTKGFVIIVEPHDARTPHIAEPLFQFCCLDSSIAMQPIFRKYKSVVITSGTISPLEMYPKILSFRPVVTERLPMSITRDCLSPLIVTHGSDQVALSTKYQARDQEAVIRNYGQLLLELSAVVPDGLVCFFVSYYYMEQTVAKWNDMGLLNLILNNKLLFVETQDFSESLLALENYKKACDAGRGAVLLSVARGKVSEGIDFDHHYGEIFGFAFCLLLKTNISPLPQLWKSLSS